MPNRQWVIFASETPFDTRDGVECGMAVSTETGVLRVVAVGMRTVCS